MQQSVAAEQSENTEAVMTNVSRKKKLAVIQFSNSSFLNKSLASVADSQPKEFNIKYFDNGDALGQTFKD